MPRITLNLNCHERCQNIRRFLLPCAPLSRSVSFFSRLSLGKLPSPHCPTSHHLGFKFGVEATLKLTFPMRFVRPKSFYEQAQMARSCRAGCKQSSQPFIWTSGFRGSSKTRSRPTDRRYVPRSCFGLDQLVHIWSIGLDSSKKEIIGVISDLCCNLM